MVLCLIDEYRKQVTTNVWEHNMRWLVRSLDTLVNGAEGGATSQYSYDPTSVRTSSVPIFCTCFAAETWTSPQAFSPLHLCSFCCNYNGLESFHV